MQITIMASWQELLRVANDSIVLDEGDFESCGNNPNTQFPGCPGKQFKASMLVMCAFI